MSRTESPLGLLDTSTVILIDRIKDTTALPPEPMISVITLAELSVGPLVAVDDVERAVRQGHLQQAEADFEALPFDADAARAFGRVAASLRRAGRKATARSLDAMIAATAVAHQLPLYTVNPDDFAGIDALDVRPVTHPDHQAPG
jgi:tRNA(fMet)-specific endonuclease VapC